MAYRQAPRDHSISISPASHSQSVHVPQGADVSLHFMAAHYNRKSTLHITYHDHSLSSRQHKSGPTLRNTILRASCSVAGVEIRFCRLVQDPARASARSKHSPWFDTNIQVVLTHYTSDSLKLRGSQSLRVSS